MDAAVVGESITEQLLQRLEESRFLHVPVMNRIEGRIRSKEQLSRYISVLVHKLEEREFADEWLIDRIDRLLELHQRLEQYERSGGASISARWDDADASVGERLEAARR